MNFFKAFLLFLSLIFVSALYADIKDDAQEQENKISKIEAELNKASAEASAAKDQKWKSCVGKHLSTVKGLVASATNIATKIPNLVALGKMSEARSQLIVLNGMADFASKALAEAQTCERSVLLEAQVKNQQTFFTKGGVSSAMTLEMGNFMPTETNRGAIEGTDSADAANIEASGEQQTTNDDSSNENLIISENPEDASQIEQIPPQEDQSPTM